MPFHIESHGDEFEVVDDKGKSYGVHKTRQQAIDQQKALYANVPEASKKEADEMIETDKALWSTAMVNDLPDSSFLYIESGGDKDGDGKTTPRSLRHFPYKDADGKIDLPHLRNAIARIPQSNAPGLNKDALQKRAQKILADNSDAESAKKEADEQPSALDRIANFFKGKEGRRHSSTDQDAIQQIHDLSTKAGADCALMVKEVNGKARWVLLSSNAYEDRDHEWVSEKAQKRDVKRMKESGNYGPLRLWHLGYPDVEKKEAGPGLDIGDCDYAEMVDGFRVESGTFRNERVAAAIKERADQWATSVGFFHPTDQPDPSGVYHEMYTFERSLLPRTKAANNLTPLAAILKEMRDMTTKEEKLAGLSKLFDNDPAVVELVTKALDTSKKEAEQRGLTLKDKKDTPPEAAAEKSGKKADEPDEDDMDGMDEATAKAYKAMLPHIVKTIHALTKASNMEDAAAREAKAAKKEKKAAKKAEKAKAKAAAREKEVDDMKAKIDQIAAVVAELNGDVPRALQGGFRATQSDANLLSEGVIAALKQGQMPDPIGGFLQGMGLDQFNMKGGG